MKIAISLPDPVFRRVERAAKRLHISRSEFLARAATVFLAEEQRESVKDSYDRAFAPGGRADKSEERFRSAATRLALLDVEW